MTASARGTQDTAPGTVLHLAFEFGAQRWKRGFTTALGQLLVAGENVSKAAAEMSHPVILFGVTGAAFTP